ncbi:MAG: hypothetical protein ACKOAY_06665 [Haliscomenobacter sp.]
MACSPMAAMRRLIVNLLAQPYNFSPIGGFMYYMNRKVLLSIWLILGAWGVRGQETLLEAVVETNSLYVNDPLRFELPASGKSFTLIPRGKDLSRFQVNWEDGTIWLLKFGEEIAIQDTSGALILTTINQKSFVPVGAVLLHRQLAAHGIQYLDQEEKKVFSAIRYGEGLFPVQFELWLKTWSPLDMPEPLAVMAVAELLRQCYFFEG